MKERKRLPYLPLFIDDWMQSSGVCDCSDATRGIYIDLMCVLFKEKVRGAYSLHSKEMRWHYSRSKTQLALAKPNVSERLPYFVDFLVKPLRSTRSAILKALQELLYHDIIVIVNDVLIQPRMYRDYGGKLLDEGGEDERLALPDISEAKAVAAEDGKAKNKKNKKGEKSGAKKASENSAEKTPENPRARASCACARTPSESGSENNNKGIDSSSKGGVGEISRSGEETDAGRWASQENGTTAKGEKTAAKKPAAFTPPTQEEVTAYCQERGYTFDPIQFWNHYEANGWVQGRNKPIRKWQACCVTWQQRENHGEFGVRGGQQRGQPAPTGAMKQGVQVTEVRPGQYDEEW